MSSLRTWRWVLAAVLLLAATGCQPSGERALVEGDRLLSASRAAEAVPLLERAVETLPQNAVALNRLGLAYQYVGRMEDARKQYLRALKADQNLFEAQHNLGILYFDTENWIEAERCLRIWLGRHPEDLEAWNRLGLAQFRNGAPLEAAEQSLSNVARANTKDPEVWNTLGLISLKRHKYKEAQQRFGYGLKLDPGNAALHLNLAVLLHQYLNDRRGAVPHYRTFLEISPNAPEAEAVRTLLLQLDPPAPPPRAEVTNLNTRTLVVAPVAATNPPAPVATRTPAVVPSNTPPAVVSPVYNNIITERRSAPEAVSAPVSILKSNPPAIRAAPALVAAVPTPATNPAPRVAAVALATNPIEPPRNIPAPPAPKQVVKLEDEFRPVAAVDSQVPKLDGHPGTLEASPTNGVATSSVAPASSADIGGGDDVADPLPKPQGKPKSFWKRINPVGWFKGDAPTNTFPPKLTPLDLPAATVARQPSAPVPSRNTNQIVAALPVPVFSPPPKPIVPRYRRQDASRLAPGDRSAADPEFAKGSDAQRQRNYTEAMAAYRQAAELDHSFFEAYYNWSLAALDAGDSAQAAAAAENATLLQPANDDARLNFAIALQRSGFSADAAEEFEKLSNKRPNDAATHFALASIYARELMDNDKARPHYVRVITLDPQHPKADAIRAWLAGNR